MSNHPDGRQGGDNVLHCSAISDGQSNPIANGESTAIILTRDTPATGRHRTLNKWTSKEKSIFILNASYGISRLETAFLSGYIY
jgi:hypothetical protein